MDSLIASGDKENVNPLENVQEVEAPKIYTVESEYNDLYRPTF